MDKEHTGPNESPLSLAAEAQAQAHPTLERLADYHLGKLSSDEESRAQRHLVRCRECASQLLDLAAFYEPSDDASPTQVDAAWRRFHPRMQTLPQATRSLRLSKTSGVWRHGGLFFPLRPAHALAALALGVSVLLAVWILSLNRENETLLAQLNQGQTVREQERVATQKVLAEAGKEIEEAQRRRDEARNQPEQFAKQPKKPPRPAAEPLLNVPHVDLSLDGADTLDETRGSGQTRPQNESSQLIKLRKDTVSFALTIPASTLGLHYPDYAIEITNQQDTAILTTRGLRYDSDVGFSLSLPCRLLPEGEYTFKVYGLSRGARTLVSRGVARIQYIVARPASSRPHDNSGGAPKL